MSPFTKVVKPVLAIFVALAISTGAVSAAFGATTFGVSATIVPSLADKSKGEVVVVSEISTSNLIELRVDGIVVSTDSTVPGGTTNKPTTKHIPFSGLLPGKKLSVWAIVQSKYKLEIANPYSYTGVITLTPLAPTSDGVNVVIPTPPDGQYVYKDQATGENLQPGTHPLAKDGTPLSVIAVPTSPAVVLTESGPWVFCYKTPAAILVVPLAPTFVDKCGTANDTIIYPELVEGVLKYVTGNFGGQATVRAILKPGYEFSPGAQVAWTSAFTNEPCPEPAPKPVPAPSPAPVPVPASPSVPVSQPKPAPAAVQTVQQPQAVTGNDEPFVTGGAASGAASSSPFGIVMMSVGLAMAITAVAAMMSVRRQRRISE